MWIQLLVKHYWSSVIGLWSSLEAWMPQELRVIELAPLNQPYIHSFVQILVPFLLHIVFIISQYIYIPLQITNDKYSGMPFRS